MGGGTWGEVISVLKEMQKNAAWSEDDAPSPFLFFLAYAHHQAGLTDTAHRQYEVLLERMGHSAITNSFIVHIGAHIKTFSSSAGDAIAFLKQAAEDTSFFVGAFREHVLMHLGALYAFNLDFDNGLSIYDRLWDAPGGDGERHSSFFQWNATLLLWYLELSTVSTENGSKILAARIADLDRRWVALARIVDASEDSRDLVHGYLSVLSAFALRRGGFEEAAASILREVRMRCREFTLLANLQPAQDVDATKIRRAETSEQEHWQQLTLPLLEGCLKFADVLRFRSGVGLKHMASRAQAATKALQEHSEDAVTERLGVSDEQRLVFRFSYYAALLLAGTNSEGLGDEINLSCLSKAVQNELLEGSPARPRWRIESTWARACQDRDCGVGGA